MILINRKDLPEANTTCKICGRKYRLCKRCLQLRTMGIESWRENCDCIECYTVYQVLKKPNEEITKEEYESILSVELPVGQEYTTEIKTRFKELKKQFTSETKNQTNEWKQTKGQTKDVKKYDYGYDKKRATKSQYNR